MDHIMNDYALFFVIHKTYLLINVCWRQWGKSMSVSVEEEEPRILLKVDEKNKEKDIIKMMVEKLFIIKSLYIC